jgi:hypothetical protein
MQTIKLISILCILCIGSLIIFLFIWDGGGFPLKKSTRLTETETSKTQKEPPQKSIFEKGNGSYYSALFNKFINAIPQEIAPKKTRYDQSLKRIEDAAKALLSKIYLKFRNDDGNPFFVQNEEDTGIFDAEGAIGFRFNSRSQKFYAIPIIGYTLNLQIVKPDETPFSEPFSSITHWKGPFVGLNAVMHLSRFFSVDAGYSFHWINFQHLFYNGTLTAGAPETFLALHNYSNNGLGHSGLLGFSFILVRGWQFGINCKYKQFRAAKSNFITLSERADIYESFQASGEIAFKF